MRRGRGALDQKAVVEKAGEIKETALELAGSGGEAVKEFVASTGSAAKEFASATAQAAKELLDSTEKAVERMNRKAQPRRRGRKLFKATVALGVAAGVLSNQKARGKIGSVLGKGGNGQEPMPFERGTSEFRPEGMPSKTST